MGADPVPVRKAFNIANGLIQVVTPADLAITISLTIAGIVATWFFARRYYKKGSKDIVEVLESLQLADIRLKQGGGYNEGKIRKGPDGKWGVDWTKVVVEDRITVSDSMKPKNGYQA